MNKAEELKVVEFLTSKGLTCFEYLHGSSMGEMSYNQLCELFQQYADEVSRERAINFANHLSDIVTNGDDLFGFDEEYIEWLKEQEEQ